MQGEQDYYKVLGIAPSASVNEITKAYRKLAFQYHPDRYKERVEAHKKMKEINEAYAILSDPIKRRDYDLPRGYGRIVPKFKKGSNVKISVNYPSPYAGHTGFVDKEPVRDTFRFWYMVRIQTKGLMTVTRFAEEELEEPDD